MVNFKKFIHNKIHLQQIKFKLKAVCEKIDGEREIEVERGNTIWTLTKLLYNVHK